MLASVTVLQVVFLTFRARLPIEWTRELSNLADGLSMLGYGLITLSVSGRLWFYQVFRAPWEQSVTQEPVVSDTGA